MRDKGYRKMLKHLAELVASDQEITVGIHSEEGASYDGISVQEVAAIHEFGQGDVPERSFVRAWAEESEPDNVRTIAAALRDGIRRKNDQALQQVAVKFAGDIKKRIVAGIGPPLKSREGTPLYDTKQLAGSVHGKLNGKKAG